MAIIPLLSKGAGSNCYLVIDEKTLLIDAGTGLDDRIVREVNSRLKGRELDFIVNTHAHFDHCAGDTRFKEASVHIHRDDAKELVTGNFYGTYRFFGVKHPVRFHRLLEHGDRLELGEHILQVIHTPGHTHGSICLIEKDAGILFSGDILFPEGGFGRIDMGGDVRQIIQTLERLAKISFDKLYPGHGSIVSNGVKHAEASLKNARMLMSL
jgi:glyoxylase-like metal-dependent hydrolase (beta-lactamase superfamily II)